MPRKPNTINERYCDVFPTRLRDLMEENGTKQEELARVLGVKARQSITGYTDGSTIPTADKIVALAKFFHVSTDYLVGLRDEKTPDVTLQGVCDYTGLSEDAAEAIRCALIGRHGFTPLNTLLAAKATEINISLISLDFAINDANKDIALMREEISADPENTWHHPEKIADLQRDIYVSMFELSELCRTIPELFGSKEALDAASQVMDIWASAHPECIVHGGKVYGTLAAEIFGITRDRKQGQEAMHGNDSEENE